MARRHQPAGAAGNHSSGTNAVASDSNSGDPPIIIAVAEGRKSQIALAWIDLAIPNKISVVSISESSNRFPDTIDFVRFIDPTHVLMSAYSFKGALYKHLTQSYIDDDINPPQFNEAATRYFNDMEAYATYEKICSPMTIDALGMRSKYLVLAAFGCVTKYCEYVEGAVFGLQCVEVQEKPPLGRMILSAAAIKNLEIVSNKRDGKKKNSLLSLFHTKTKTGERLLRSTLVSPSTDRQTINQRLDAVDVFLSNETALLRIRSILPKVRLEQSLRYLTFSRKLLTAETSQQAIKMILSLKSVLPQARALLGELEPLVSGGDAKSELLEAVVKQLKNDTIEVVEKEIEKYIQYDFSLEKKEKLSSGRNAQLKEQREIFSIHSGISGILDVSRQTYISLLDEIDKLFDHYRLTWQLRGLRLGFNKKRGHYMSVPKLEAKNLPSHVIDRTNTTKFTTFTTHDLHTLVTRTREAVKECYTFTALCLKELNVSLQNCLIELSHIVESVAFVDLIQSFASYVVNSEGSFARPEILDPGAGTGGKIVVKQGRHPIVSALPNRQYVANDTFVTPSNEITLVFGENNAGKSTYLRQQALIIILAQSGCFVPASRASISIFDRILTRLSCEDDIEGNISSFLMECQEISNILKKATKNSLVLIDELGRATSTIDGLSLSWALVVELANQIHCATLFATHFHDLHVLKNIHPNLSTLEIGNHSQRFLVGTCTNDLIERDYGIKHAELCGMPKEVLELSEKLRAEFLKHDDRNSISVVNENREQEGIRLEIGEKLNLYKQQILNETNGVLGEGEKKINQRSHLKLAMSEIAKSYVRGVQETAPSSKTETNHQEKIV